MVCVNLLHIKQKGMIINMNRNQLTPKQLELAEKMQEENRIVEELTNEQFLQLLLFSHRLEHKIMKILLEKN